MFLDCSCIDGVRKVFVMHIFINFFRASAYVSSKTAPSTCRCISMFELIDLIGLMLNMHSKFVIDWAKFSGCMLV